MKRRNDDNDEGGKGDYFVIVVCDGTGKVVGTGTVVVERKLYVPSLLFSLSLIFLSFIHASRWPSTAFHQPILPPRLWNWERGANI